MKKKTLLGIFLIIVIVIIVFYSFFNSNYYKLKTLYNNPIRVNQVYGDYTYDEYDKYVTILSYLGDEKEVIIPEKINDKPVYSIDDSAFYANPNLERVVLSKYIIRIGHQTFIGNANLREVVLSDNLLDIGGWAFDGCPKLEKLYVKKGSKTEITLNKLDFKKYVVYK